jgi:hypothetical protein
MIKVAIFVALFGSFVCGGCKSKYDNYFNGDIRYFDKENVISKNVESKSVSLDGAYTGMISVYDSLMVCWNPALSDTKFDESITTAQSKGIRVAWSNDCFEIWILLHFDIPDEAFIRNHDHRDRCYERLTDIFRNHQSADERFNRIKESGNLSYKTHLKSQRLFSSVVKPAIRPLTDIAVERAKALEGMYDANAKPHDKIPCTKVYELVELLLSEGM